MRFRELKHEADTRTTAVTRHVQIGSTEASAGRIQRYPILLRHSLGKNRFVRRGEKRKKEPGISFSTSDVLHEIPIPPLQVRTHHVTEAAFK